MRPTSLSTEPSLHFTEHRAFGHNGDSTVPVLNSGCLRDAPFQLRTGVHPSVFDRSPPQGKQERLLNACPTALDLPQGSSFYCPFFYQNPLGPL